MVTLPNEVVLVLAALLVVQPLINSKFGRLRRRLRRRRRARPERPARRPFKPVVVGAPQPSASPQGQCIVGKARVTDGDGIEINHIKIRLFGIDAPEQNHPYGRVAKSELSRLCDGQMVSAEVTDTDHYGRVIARCRLPDGRDLSAEMVKRGLAIDWPKFSGGAYRHLETPDARQKMFLAEARQKGRMDVWDRYEARQRQRSEELSSHPRSPQRPS